MIMIHQGDIFDINCQALVNPVNCVGIMGKGLALEFRLRYPAMFEWYRDQCGEKNLYIGNVLTWETKAEKNPEYIINFPTKIHWQNPSYFEYIEMGLMALKREIIKLKLDSIAIPALGCGEGKLDFDNVLDAIGRKLNPPISEERKSINKLKIYVFPPKGAGKWAKKNY